MLNKLRKFGAKIFLQYANIVIFVLGYFILTHPVGTVFLKRRNTIALEALVVTIILDTIKPSYCLTRLRN